MVKECKSDKHMFSYLNINTYIRHNSHSWLGECTKGKFKLVFDGPEMFARLYPIDARGLPGLGILHELAKPATMTGVGGAIGHLLVRATPKGESLLPLIQVSNGIRKDGVTKAFRA